LQTLIVDSILQRGEFESIERIGVERFSVNVLSMRRTVVEKILGVTKNSCDDDPVAKWKAS
jgi:hypothetical protein